MIQDMEANKPFDSKENPMLCCGVLNNIVLEEQWSLNITKATLKQEPADYVDEDTSPCLVYPADPLGPSEFENYFDNESHENHVKREPPDNGCPGPSGTIVSQTVFDDKDSIRVLDREQIKQENTEAKVSCCIKKEDVNTEQDQLQIKVELLKQHGLLDNYEETNPNCKVSIIKQDHVTERVPKTNLQRQREYQQRKRNQQIRPKKTPKTNTEHQRAYRQRQKLVKNENKRESCNLLNHNGKNIKNETNIPGDNELYNCPYCDKYFVAVNSMRTHVKDVHRQDNCKCETCGKIFKCRKNLAFHIKKMHCDYGGRMFECWCGKEYRSPIHLREHKARLHNVTKESNNSYKCQHCDIAFKFKHSLERHTKSIHYDYGRTFECWCGKQFRIPKYLNMHKSRYHNTKNINYQCDYCQKFFTMKHNLIGHIKRIHCDFRRICQCWCGKQFRTKVHLYEHKRLQHDFRVKNKKKVEHKCEICEVIFKVKQSLMDHINRIHSD